MKADKSGVGLEQGRDRVWEGPGQGLERSGVGLGQGRAGVGFRQVKLGKRAWTKGQGQCSEANNMR